MEALIFQGRVYVPTTQGLRRASATPEEMDKMEVVNNLLLYPLTRRSTRNTSRNRKSTHRGKVRSGTVLPYGVQQEIAQLRKTKRERRLARKA